MARRLPSLRSLLLGVWLLPASGTADGQLGSLSHHSCLQEEWEYGKFRDCNGVSNGTPLPAETLAAEAAAGPYHGTPAGEVGPPPDAIKAHHGAHHGAPLPVPVHPPVPVHHHPPSPPPPPVAPLKKHCSN